MLRDVVDEIIGVEPDLHVIADGVESGTLLEHVERTRPDVVVLWAESASPPPMCEELLGRFPRLSVVAIEDRGQRASIYRMRPMRVRLAEVSGNKLVATIRRAARAMSFRTSMYDASRP